MSETPERHRHPHQAAGARHEHGGRCALAGDIADQKAAQRIGRVEAIVEIAADLAGRLDEGVHVDRLLRRVIREFPRQHPELELAGRVELAGETQKSLLVLAEQICLLLQRLAQLVQQPRVFNGDRRLLGEAFDQRNVSRTKGPYFPTKDLQGANQLALPQHRYDQERALAKTFRDGDRPRLAREIGGR
jgi:hypothetical protein